MIDSLTGAENNPENNSPPDQQKRAPEGSRSDARNRDTIEETNEPQERKPASSPPADTPKAPLGGHIDLTA
ncbi:MAG: hypothetical protein Kow0099_01610 [Candidatus Abyssubacteria bacterium]